MYPSQRWMKNLRTNDGNIEITLANMSNSCTTQFIIAWHIVIASIISPVHTMLFPRTAHFSRDHIHCIHHLSLTVNFIKYGNARRSLHVFNTQFITNDSNAMATRNGLVPFSYQVLSAVHENQSQFHGNTLVQRFARNIMIESSVDFYKLRTLSTSVEFHLDKNWLHDITEQ